MVAADPGTVLVYSDVGCPWAYLAVHRLRATRSRLGLDDVIVLDHRAFPLELVNREPTPWALLGSEIPVIAGLDPDAGIHVWDGHPATWPVTTLPAMEAVQAAKQQDLRASERLDVALRRAFFAEGRCISLRHVILEAAAEADVDVAALEEALDTGTARRRVIDNWRVAQDEDVTGSPQLFLPDGSEVHNPGIEIDWTAEQGSGFPVVTADQPGVYEGLLRRAAELSGATGGRSKTP